MGAGLFALLVWWGATQALIWLVRLAGRTTLNIIALVLGLGSFWAAILTADITSQAGAFAGFGAGLGLWAAFEIAFLSGAVVGIPTRSDQPTLLGRAWAAFQAIIWHELALAGTLIVLAAVTIGAANPVALYAFALLWIMRISAKLNLFLGVRNHCAELLPLPIRHLSRHFRLARMNALLPFSVLAGTLGAAFLLRVALDPSTGSGEATGAALLAVLVALGTAEHWLMVTPFSPLRLWSSTAPRVTLARPVGAITTTL